MSAELLDGKAIANEIKQELGEEVAKFIEDTSVVPCLAAVLVGEDPASRHVRDQGAIEVARVHVDELVVGQVVLDVEHEHRVRDVCAARQRGGKEAVDGDAFAPQVTLRVGRCQLHGVDTGIRTQGPEVISGHGHVVTC